MGGLTLIVLDFADDIKAKTLYDDIFTLSMRVPVKATQTAASAVA